MNQSIAPQTPEEALHALREENETLRAELSAAHREIEELSQEVEEKAMALASSAQAARPQAPAPSPVSSLIRSAFTHGSTQSRARIALLEEELGRQAERHAARIAQSEAHFVAKLAEVAGGGEKAVLEVLRDRIVELERECADPPLVLEARGTIARLQAELEELRAENRFLSSEVERWASLAQVK